MRILRPRTLPAAALLSLLACWTAGGCEPPQPGEAASMLVSSGFADGTRHPTSVNIPARGSLAAFIPMKDELNGPGELRRYARALRDARLLWTVGRMDGDQSQVFGNVEDIAVDEEGRLYVLDSRYNNVRIHDRAGAAVGVFGGPGRGPGELMSPEAIERDAQGRLVVADRFNTLKVFERRGDRFESTRSIPVRFVPEDFCLLGDRIFVQGVRRDGGVIHAFSATGDSVVSFGAPYRSENWLVRNQLSDGPIACNEPSSTVVAMFKYLPVIYGYGPGGEVKWVSQLADFRPIGITEEVEGEGTPVVAFSPREDGHDLVAALMSTGPFVLVQTARHTVASIAEQKEFQELRTYLVEAATGNGVYVGNHLPRLAAVAGDCAYAAVNDPHPQVRVFQVAQAGGGR
jgi:hypothetical protein